MILDDSAHQSELARVVSYPGTTHSLLSELGVSCGAGLVIVIRGSTLNRSFERSDLASRSIQAPRKTVTESH